MHLKGTDTAPAWPFFTPKCWILLVQQNCQEDRATQDTQSVTLKVTAVCHDLFTWSLCFVSSKAETTCLRSLVCLRSWDPSTVLGKIHGSICNCICWFYMFFFSGSPVFNEGSFFFLMKFQFCLKQSSKCLWNGFIPPQQSWVPDLEIIETVFTHSAWSIPMGFLTSEHVSFHQQGLQQSAMTFSPLAQKLNMNL